MEGINIRLQKIMEYLFLCLIGVYLFYLFVNTTMFKIEFPANFERDFLRVFAFTACARAFGRGKADRKLMAGIGLLILFGIVFSVDQYYFLLYLGYGMLGCIDIDYRKVLKIYTIETGCLIFITVVAALSGAITNLVYISDRGYPRGSFGGNYPTDFASHILFFCLFLWCAYRELKDWAMLIIAFLCLLFTRYVVDSQTSTICSILLIICIIYHIFELQVIEKKNKLKSLKKIVDFLLVSAFPLLGSTFCLIVVLYMAGNRFSERLNQILSNRIGLAAQAIEKYGINLFGTPFSMVGNGGSTFGRSGYNFIDSSYILILIRYGVVLLVVLGIVWALVTKKMINSGNGRLALCMGIIAVHAMSEHHFTDLGFNILLLLPLASLEGQTSPETEMLPQANKDKKAVIIRRIVCGIAIIAALLSAPRVISYMRTIVNKAHLTGGGNNGKLVMIAIAGGMAVYILFFRCIYKCVCAVITRKKVRWIVPAFMVLCVLGTGAVYVKGERMMESGLHQYRKRLTADEAAMNVITSVKGSKVYVDKIPNIYGRKFPNIQRSILSGDDLARLKCATVVMDTNHDSPSFILQGYLYTEISDYHCIYTNDPGVIAALKSSGYNLTDYYAKEKEVNLPKLSKVNNQLICNEKDGLILLNKQYSIKHGPYYDLCQGNYIITLSLHMDPKTCADNYIACVIDIGQYYGQDILATQNVQTADFDEKGDLTVEVPFTVSKHSGTSGVEFLVSDIAHQKICVKKMTYRKISNVNNKEGTND